MGFDLIIDAISTGPISEERMKRFILKDQDQLMERGGAVAVNIANDALNVLSGERLATIDPFKVSQWIKEEASRRR